MGTHSINAKCTVIWIYLMQRHGIEHVNSISASHPLQLSNIYFHF